MCTRLRRVSTTTSCTLAVNHDRSTAGDRVPLIARRPPSCRHPRPHALAVRRRHRPRPRRRGRSGRRRRRRATAAGPRRRRPPRRRRRALAPRWWPVPMCCARPPGSAARPGSSAIRPSTYGSRAARAPGCGAARVTVSRAPPVAAFSSADVPSAITVPWSMTTMRSASSSASSRYWVVSSRVAPSATSSRITSHMRSRLVGSSPVVGSSRNSTGGRVTRPAARSRRRRIPPEYPFMTRSAASVSSKRSRSSRARALASGRRSPLSSPTITRFCRPVSSSSRVASWAVTPIWRRTAPASTTTSRPATRAQPASGTRQGGENTHRRRLARAVRPEHAEDRSGGHGEIDAGERLGRAVALPESFGFDHGCAGHGGPYWVGGTRFGWADRPRVERPRSLRLGNLYASSPLPEQTLTCRQASFVTHHTC